MKWLFGSDRFGSMMAAVALASAGTWAHAEPLSSSTSHVTPVAETARTVVLIQSQTPAAIEVRLVANLRWQLTELELGLREVPATSEQTLQEFVQQAEQIASSGDVLLVAWITHGASATSIYLFDPKGPHLYARQVAVSDSPAAASEELALIVRSALQARLDGGSLAMPEIALPAESATKANSALAVPARAKLPEASSAPLREPVPVLLGWGAGVGGVMSRPVSRGDWQAGLALRAWARWWPVRLGIGYAALPALNVATDRASMVVNRHPIELFAGFEWSTRRFTFVAESVFAMDALQRHTTRVSPPRSARGPDGRWLATVGERLRVEARVLAPVWLSLAGGIEIPLNPYKFEVASADQRFTIAEMLPVRPTFEIGLVFR